MSLRFYDTKTRAVRDFQPIIPGKVGLYYCGATVQGMPHVGHVRSAVAFDILRRWLTYRGFDVTVVRNVTDIDDKILEKSALSYEDPEALGPDYVAAEPWFALAYRFEDAFRQAYAALGVLPPTYEPRATGHMTEMFALIQRLIEAGHAYPAPDGSGDVYFDVRSFPEYGALTHQRVEDMQEAPDADPRGKRDPRDFALWKGSKPGEPATAGWDSPWGRGRPGWHLECSAMATRYLGSGFDIHGGGLDLRFPHHENEMAQSHAAGDPFANFWMHNGMVTYGGEKMSKSLGNTISPQQMLQMAPARVVRYFLGQAHYRSQLDYAPGSLQEARSALERIDRFLARAAALMPDAVGSPSAVRSPAVEAADDAGTPAALGDVPAQFAAAMDDDLNVPAALAVLHESVRAGNAALDAAAVASGPADAGAAGTGTPATVGNGRGEAPEHLGEDIARTAREVAAMVAVLGLDAAPEAGSSEQTQQAQALDALVDARLAARAQARAQKDWATSDAIRDELAAVGIDVADSATGANWSLRS